MKINRSIIATLLCTYLLPQVQADTFTLTDGTKLKGEIIGEEGDSYIIRAEISSGIRDDRKIKKILVEKIVKTDKSIARYEAIKNTLPAPDRLKATDYENVIKTSIDPFLKEFPDSKFTPDVKKMKETLESELEQIKSGGIKVNGKIVTPSERALNQYEFDALLIYLQMQDDAKKRDFTSAMEQFEILNRDYKSTIHFKPALELTHQLLPVFKQELMDMSSKVETVTMKRDITLDRLDSGNKNRAEKLLMEEENSYQSKLAEAKNSKTKWLPINRFHKKQIDTNIKLLERETEKINKLEMLDIDGGEAYRDIIQHLDKNEIKEAKEAFRTFKSGRPPKSYSNALNDRIREADQTMKELEAEKKREAAEEARMKRKAEMEQKRAEKTKK